MQTLTLSSLPKTWLFDLDGTLVRHNGHLTEGRDTLLAGVREFFAQISKDDKVVLLTARSGDEVASVREFLAQNGLQIHAIISDLPFGERILINDTKPSGLKTAYAINKARDEALEIEVEIEEYI